MTLFVKLKQKRKINHLIKSLTYMAQYHYVGVKGKRTSMIGSEEWVRMTQELVEMWDGPAGKLLVDHLNNDGLRERRFAARILRGMGYERAMKPLIRALKDNAWEMRRFAAQILGEIGDKRALEPLIRALTDPENRKPIHWLDVEHSPRPDLVLDAAAEALGKIGDAHAVKPLLRLGSQAAREGLRMILLRAAADVDTDDLLTMTNPNTIQTGIERVETGSRFLETDAHELRPYTRDPYARVRPLALQELKRRKSDSPSTP